MSIQAKERATHLEQDGYALPPTAAGSNECRLLVGYFHRHRRGIRDFEFACTAEAHSADGTTGRHSHRMR